LRAGLLSDPEVIHRLNKNFVCTSTIIDDVQKLAKGGNELARRLADQWEYPVEMMFFTPQGQLVSKLNSYQDFPGVHPDVVSPPKKDPVVARKDDFSHVDIFLKHLALHFRGM
jgi:hypothetical protein